MLSYRFLQKKRNRISLMISSFLLIMYLSTFIEGAYEDILSASRQDLDKVTSFNIPIREISGLYYNPDNQRLTAVGDKYAKYHVSRLSDNHLAPIESKEFNHAILDRYSVCQNKQIPMCNSLNAQLTSQWEAVDSDASGQLFFLHEQLATIFVYNQINKQITTTINLEGFSDTNSDLNLSKSISRKNSVKKNALAEGFILLNNGHILVVKEREPSAIIEYGPKEDSASNYRPSQWLGHNKIFPIPTQSDQSIKLHPLKVWTIDKDYPSCDLSELKTDPTGLLYALSQSCKMIMQIGDLDITEKYFTVKKSWKLPEYIKKAESFIIFDSKRFIVAQDIKSIKENNVFVLKKNRL